MTTRKKFKLLLILVIAVVGITTISHFSVSSGIQKEREKIREDIVCISAICLDTGIGNECFTLPSTISKISIVEDLNVFGAKRLIIEPGDSSCGVIRNGGTNGVP